jgi:hypothetical protein
VADLKRRLLEESICRLLRLRLSNKQRWKSSRTEPKIVKVAPSSRTSLLLLTMALILEE